MVIITKLKGEKLQVLQNAIFHHPPTHSKPPFLNPDQSILQVTPPVHVLAMMFWGGISLWSVQANSTSYAPFQIIWCAFLLVDKEKSP